MSYLDTNAEKLLFVRQKEMIRRLGKKGAINVFDVGGNLGQSIEGYRALFPACRITTFEPLPRCFEKLTKKYGGGKGISLENVALAEKSGSHVFYATAHHSASSLLPPEEKLRKRSKKRNYEFEKITVPLDTLDGYCARNRISSIDILKIDVQGAELRVLKGAKRTLSSGNIGVIYVEIIIADTYNGQSEFIDTAAFLSSQGYRLWDFRPFLFTRTGRLWQANALFVSPPVFKKLDAYKTEFPRCPQAI
ncbi:MAG: FkbM family methyltransferase [Chitinispirillaceae bacterium]|nr:FkbM family methyltransferase [Chitinispirillaceae bacterium]